MIIYPLMKHEKNCWTVTLFTDGAIRINSNFKKKADVYLRLEADEKIVRLWGYHLPKYVLQMVYEMRLYSESEGVSHAS